MNKINSTNHEIYMRRCFQLARLGESYVAPNPMVGAVLVHEGTIIGEGYHRRFGEVHAEVNCLNSVSTVHRNLISKSTLYVSLEPCTHFGKTPPCSDLIIQYKIPKVVISVQDAFDAINGKGIERMKAHGIEVITGILEAEGKELLKHFFCFHQQHRPFITLKFAQTSDNSLGLNGKEILISNALSKRYVHHLRAQHQGILVGKNTVLTDNPELTLRYWNGKNPIRIILGNKTAIPSGYHIYSKENNNIFLSKGNEKLSIPNILEELYKHQIISVLVEGGASVLQQFINSNLWDEAHIITNERTLQQIVTTQSNQIIKAPSIKGESVSTLQFENDHIQILKNLHALSHS